MTGHDPRGTSTGRSRRGRGQRAALISCAAVLLASCAAGAGADTADRTSPAATSPVPSTTGAGGSLGAPTGAGIGSVHPVTTVVLTDDSAVSAAGPTAAGSWPGFLADRLASSGSPLELAVAADDGAGFAPWAPDGPSFTELVVAEVSHATQLVVFHETRFGPAEVAEVARGAERAFSAVEEAAPDARIVVVAPWASQHDLPAPDQGVRDAVRAAADSAEVAVTYVDPAAERWPTVTSQDQVAELLQPHVGSLVQALAESGAFD